MRSRVVLTLLVCVALLLPGSAALADPPPHAPAHGHRSKVWKSPKFERRVPAPPPRNGVEIVFDSERGVYVGIGIPDLFFHDGTYYRMHEGRWQVSSTGDGNWRRRASFRVPDSIVAAAKRSLDHPLPAAVPD